MNRSVLLFYFPWPRGQVKTFIVSSGKNLLKEFT